MKAEKKTLFISYCQRDGNFFADELESQLSDYFLVKRDKSQMIANDDIYDFMAEIANEDYVAIVLTSGYLKSESCMLEVSYLLNQPDWAQKVLVLVVQEEIYGIEVKLDVLDYWRKKERERAEMLERADIGSDMIRESHESLVDINEKLEEFLEGVNRRKNPSQIAIVNEFVRKLKQDEQGEHIRDIIAGNRDSVCSYVASHPDATAEDIAKELRLSFAYTLRLLKSLADQNRLASSLSERKRKRTYRIDFG